MKISNKFVNPLTDNEIYTLKQLKKNSNSARTTNRAHAILLSNKLYPINNIAHILDSHRNSVSTWIDAWKSCGIVGLFDKHIPGAPSKINDIELEKVKNIIEENMQSPKTIRAKIAEELGEDISQSTLKRLIKKINMKWKRLRKSLKDKRDDEKFEQAMHEINELEKSKDDGDIDLYYFDESGFSINSLIPYAYQKIGETVELPAERSNNINVVGFYNKNNDLKSYCFDCNIDSKIAVACFDQFSTTITQKTYVILDNAPVHHSNEFKNNIPKWEEKGLFLKYLPPYSPELNIIEILWRFMKYSWLPISAYLSFNNLKEKLEYVLKNVGKEYRINFAK